MNGRLVYLLLALTLGSVLTACVSRSAARLTKSQVIQSAEDLIKQRGGSVGADLSAKAVFLSDVGRWRVSFHSRPASGPIAWEAWDVVFVDDQTGAATMWSDRWHHAKWRVPARILHPGNTAHHAARSVWITDVFNADFLTATDRGRGGLRGQNANQGSH